MALSNEDKKDVAGAMGKAMANKVSKVTRDKDGYYKGKLKAPSGKEFEITKPRSNPFAGGSWDYGASASRASKDKNNALYSPKSKALSKKSGDKYNKQAHEAASKHRDDAGFYG